MAKTIIAVKHFTLGGRESLETAVKIYLIFLNISCSISDSTKTIKLLALDFYEMIVDPGFASSPSSTITS